MDKLYSFIPKKTLILIIVLILIITGLALTLFLRQSRETPKPPLPVISQSPVPVTPLQKTIPGVTTSEAIEKNYQIKDKQVLPNGDLSYSINSKLDARPNQIIFRNNLAQFERIVILGNESYSGVIKISDQMQKYGPAEKILEGSKFYGNHLNAYIYPSKGFSFIANPNTEEVYEIQVFYPISLDNYLSAYGEDIIGEVKPVEEEFVNGTQ